jgi:ferredoxin
MGIVGDMAKKPTVDQKKCIGCQLCTTISSVFVINSNGKAEVKEGNFDETKVNEAIKSCPMQAISWK